MENVYYLSNDIFRNKDIEEIKYLTSKFKKIIIITDQKDETKAYKSKSIRYLRINSKSFIYIRIIKIWGKIVFLLARTSQSETDKKFPKRNIYSTPKYLRAFINFIWILKLKINLFLPYFSDIYYLPLLILRECKYIFRPKRRKIKRIKSRNRVLIYDPILTNMYHLYGIKNNYGFVKSQTIGFVRSWDNPFYGQFDRNCNQYIVWSQEMRKDIINIQGFTPKIFDIPGAIYLKSFKKSVSSLKESENYVINKKKDYKLIAYAAAFSDKELAQSEIELIVEFNEIIKSNNLKRKIVFRPYPAVPLSFYRKLDDLEYVTLETGITKYERLYRHSNLLVKKTSDEEKLAFCNKCDYFISIGSSFTFEALISGIEVIQLYINKKNRTKEYQNYLFDRIEISDHLMKYFVGNIKTLYSEEEVIKYNNLNNANTYKKQQSLLRQLGIY